MMKLKKMIASILSAGCILVSAILPTLACGSIIAYPVIVDKLITDANGNPIEGAHGEFTWDVSNLSQSTIDMIHRLNGGAGTTLDTKFDSSFKGYYLMTQIQQIILTDGNGNKLGKGTTIAIEASNLTSDMYDILVLMFDLESQQWVTFPVTDVDYANSLVYVTFTNYEPGGPIGLIYKTTVCPCWEDVPPGDPQTGVETNITQYYYIGGAALIGIAVLAVLKFRNRH